MNQFVVECVRRRSNGKTFALYNVWKGMELPTVLPVRRGSAVIKMCSYPQSKSPSKIDVAHTTPLGYGQNEVEGKKMYFTTTKSACCSPFLKSTGHATSTQSHRITERLATSGRLFHGITQLERVKENVFLDVRYPQSVFSDIDMT